MLLLRGSFFLHPHRWFCCQVHDFSVQAFVAMFMFFPLMLRWWFDCKVHPFLLRGWFFCFYSISINAFSEGKSQMHNKVSIHVFVFVYFFIYSYYDMDVQFIIRCLFIIHFSFYLCWKDLRLESVMDILCYYFF